jgi:uncharacterized protein YjbJ (UPF0337 family)
MGGRRILQPINRSSSNGGKRAIGKFHWKTDGVGENMNWDQIEGKWKQFTGSAREHWGKLNQNDWEAIAGKKDQLVRQIQKRYGVAKVEAEKQANEWSRSLHQSGHESHRATRL